MPSRASSIIWTNTGGGNWSSISNWSPAVVPGPNDTALITNVGTYPVYLDVNGSVASLVVGAHNGLSTQSFYTSGQTLTVNGLILVNSHGQFNLNGGGLAGTNELSGDANGSGPLVWSGGDMSGRLLIDENSVLNIQGGANVGFTGLVLTNNGTVNWTNTGLYGYGPNNAQIYNIGAWNEQSDDTFTGGYGGGTTFFDNFGTFLKSGHSGTTTLDASVVFNNTGTLNSQFGNISLQGAYNLTHGTLNFGINNLTNYGTITLAGAASLTGTVSANLNNGYQPVSGNSFTNLYYQSFTGAFTNAVLPFANAWGTNYYPAEFVLIVSNARPTFVASTTNQYVVKELTTLTVTNSATDLESPPQTLAYSLIAGPNGIVVNPVTGLLAWTPQQTNSPSTNTVMVGVSNNGTPSLTATNTYTIIVVEVNVAPVLPSPSVKTITVQQPFAITNSATEPNIHSVTAGYLLLAAPAGAAINSSGVITWTPAQNQSLTSNTITTFVTNSNPYDAVNPHLSATNTVIVMVVPNTVTTNIVALRSAGNNLTLSWPADHAGWRLEAQTNALGTNWVPFPGSSATNMEIIPIALTNQAVFFRMIYP